MSLAIDLRITATAHLVYPFDEQHVEKILNKVYDALALETNAIEVEAHYDQRGVLDQQPRVQPVTISRRSETRR